MQAGQIGAKYQIAHIYGPCDVILSELEPRESLEKIREFYDVCLEVSEEVGNSAEQ